MLPTTNVLPSVVLLLILACVAAVWVQRLNVPYTVALVLLGIGIDALGLLPPTALDPAVVLEVLLPPLLFEAAFALRWEHLAPVAAPVALLATVGVALSAGVTAAVLVLAARIPWSLALLFGVLVAATDPVAVVAFFRRARVPSELRTLVEGESLLNDGTAVVLVGVLAALLENGVVAPMPALLEFLRVAVGGLAVGAFLGLLGSLLAHGTADYLVEATLSVALAYGSYLLGAGLHVSGVLAVVGAGSVFGNFGRRFGLERETEAEVDALWLFLAFVANSLAFLLLGVAVVPTKLLPSVGLIALGAIAAWLGRAAVAYGLGTILATSLGPLPTLWRHVLFWGGLRGALPVVVAITTTQELGIAPLFQNLVLGVVVGTLLLQGITLEPVLSRALRSVPR